MRWLVAALVALVLLAACGGEAAPSGVVGVLEMVGGPAPGFTWPTAGTLWAYPDTVESEGWDIDYYQTCLYRVSRTPEEARAQYGEAPINEIYMEMDPERMCKMIRATKKPCLAFKVFGAGRTINSPQQVEASLRYALTNIKPADAMIVGMFPKFRNEIAENIALVRKILGA